MFADDIYLYIELYKSESPSKAFTLAWTINFCIPDVKVWIVQNKLLLNDDKTEILLTGSAPGIGRLPWCCFKTILELLPLASGKLSMPNTVDSVVTKSWKLDCDSLNGLSNIFENKKLIQQDWRSNVYYSLVGIFTYVNNNYFSWTQSNQAGKQLKKPETKKKELMGEKKVCVCVWGGGGGGGWRSKWAEVNGWIFWQLPPMPNKSKLKSKEKCV